MSDFKYLNKYRVRTGTYGSDDSYGFTGFFCLLIGGTKVKIIASGDGGWQHVSVSLAYHPNTTPRWDVMCCVKGLFWEDEDVVIQFHPKKSEYISHHHGCLHLWRCTDGREQPTPPSIFVWPRRSNPPAPFPPPASTPPTSEGGKA